MRCVLLFGLLLLSACSNPATVSSSPKGDWKISYSYDSYGEVTLAMTFLPNHNFTYLNDGKTISGVWELDVRKLTLTFGDGMVWSGEITEDRQKIKRGEIRNSSFGNGSGTWYGKKLN